MLQSLTIFFTLIGAFCSMYAGIKAAPLIPAYNHKIRALKEGLTVPNNRMKELLSHLLSELEKNSFSKIEPSPLLFAKLKNLEESINSSDENMSKEIGNIFDESIHNSTMRIWQIASFLSIGIAMILQAIIILQAML
jgi:hypothetical protein